ncbi:MAG: fructose-6-phosphate aldolase [Chloroflexi bacterium CG15_BIG_FIL_POST_REV_8_21_14_020_46_15]|jgi:transaldolase|nr:MAG: fructose-6-phosphate aldolase [Dehalococcoidia bacterium CG2_30_46_19]PIW39623.1 MAG: fructose-6-phosphate aldolase [Chloroflexi bacterium CG15_BIG_FIL_POST_REV_8_21_14_020_46_15]
MRLFLDTANIEHIRHGVRLGVISGVTTNPSLISREGKVDYQKLVKEICDIVPGPVSTEVLSQDASGMINEARQVAKWADNIVVKIPANLEGVEATSVLSKEGIKVNFTLCFSLNQALLGVAAGASFVSPFVGRLDDIGEDGMKVVEDIVKFLRFYQLPTQVIAASIRHPQHCMVAAKVGAHIATVPYKVLLQMIQHPLTDIGVKRFIDDWTRVMKD